VSDSQELLAGQLVASRYRIADRIGAGGMGVVYRAVDEQLRRPVAIKVLASQARQDPDRLNRFRNEARALAALNHPHIVTIHEVGTESSFIAMELVDGETLRKRLRSGPLTVADALDVALQVARALEAAHEKGVVHRDIKPENVMLATSRCSTSVFPCSVLASRPGSRWAQSDPSKRSR
jgi:serine/threonine-protein kinase